LLEIENKCQSKINRQTKELLIIIPKIGSLVTVVGDTMISHDVPKKLFTILNLSYYFIYKYE